MIPKFFFAAAATMSAIAWTSPVEASFCSLSNLGWIAGNWRDVSDPERSQERWVAAPDHVLMGTAWEFPKGNAGYAELMTLRSSGNAVSMILRHFDGALGKAWEERETPMVFNAASCENSSAVFDGQGDHAGEHLSYSRSGDSLTIIGNFLHQGKPVRMEWHMVRAAE